MKKITLVLVLLVVFVFGSISAFAEVSSGLNNDLSSETISTTQDETIIPNASPWPGPDIS